MGAAPSALLEALQVYGYCVSSWVLPAPSWFGHDHLASALSSAHLSLPGC